MEYLGDIVYTTSCIDDIYHFRCWLAEYDLVVVYNRGVQLPNDWIDLNLDVALIEWLI